MYIKLNSIVVSTSMQTLHQNISLKVVRSTSWSSRNEWCWHALLDGEDDMRDNSISIMSGNNFSLQMNFGLETVLELVFLKTCLHL